MSVRGIIDQALTLIGVIVIVVPVTVMTESWTPLFAVLAGLLLVAMGVWRLGTRLMPERRVYLGLRSEVDHFIRLVRHVNDYARLGENEEVERLRAEMKDSVDRMILFAGQTGSEG